MLLYFIKITSSTENSGFIIYKYKNNRWGYRIMVITAAF